MGRNIQSDTQQPLRAHSTDRTLFQTHALQHRINHTKIEHCSKPIQSYIPHYTMMSLHIDKFEENHGSGERKCSESDAVHLFFTNAKRIRQNLKKISQFSNTDNPVAIIKAHGHGTTTGKADNRHFDSEAYFLQMPSALDTIHVYCLFTL